MTTIELYPEYTNMDGNIYGESTDYDTARATGTGRNFDSDKIYSGQNLTDVYGVHRGALKFYTGIIPTGATITGVKLYLKCNHLDIDTNDFDVDIYKADWADIIPDSSSNYDAIFDNILNGTKDATLLNTSAATIDTIYSTTALDTDWININGYTTYGIMSSRDKAGTSPTDCEIIGFRGYSTTDTDYPTTDAPMLSIDYTTPPGISYSINFMWGSTNYSSYNEAQRMTRFTVDRGRREVFGNRINSYDIGELRIVVDNYDGRYDPWNTDSDIYGDIKPGVKMRFTANYDGTLYTFFAGQLSDVKVNGYKNTAILICEDGWRNLRDNDLSVALTTDTTFDNAISGALSSTSYTYPWETDISSSTNIPTYHWYDMGSIKGYIEEIAYGSLGMAWIKANGEFGFRTLSDGDTSVTTISEDEVLRNVYLPMPWDNYYSDIILNGYQLYVGEPQSQYWYNYETSYRLSGNDNPPLNIETFNIEYDIDNPYPEVSTSNANITVTVEDSTGGAVGSTGCDYYYEKIGSTSCNLRVENLTTDYIWFKGTSYPYNSTDIAPIFSNANDWTFETTDTSIYNNELEIDSSWLTSAPTTMTGYTEDYTRIQDAGNTLLNYLTTLRAYPVLQLKGRYAKQFLVDLEDKITLAFDNLNISGDYRISAISHESISTPQDVVTTFYLYPVMEVST